MKATFPLLPLAMVAGASTATAAPPQGGGARVEQKLSVAIPNIPGKSLKTMIVTYAPGGSSRAHRHAASASLYAQVIEGEIRSQVDDGAPIVYKAGDYWTENPGAHHRISENASKTMPARMLVVFIVDSADTVLTAADPQ